MGFFFQGCATLALYRNPSIGGFTCLRIADFYETVDTRIQRCIGWVPRQAHFEETAANELNGCLAKNLLASYSFWSLSHALAYLLVPSSREP
jgi:hypothetical protein